MAEPLQLEVATPERAIVSAQVTDVQAPGLDGYMGILPGHAPLFSLLGSGALSYTAAGVRRFLAVQGGMLEVLQGRVRVLATLAERAEDIDAGRAHADLDRAQQQLHTASGEDASAAAQQAVALAQARIAAVEGK